MRGNLLRIGLVCGLAAFFACGDDGGSPTSDDAGTTGTETTTDPSTTTSTSASSADTGTTGTGTATGTTTDTDTATATDTGSGATCECQGDLCECSDGEDNDRDGKVDAADPECTGPCDDDESSFQTGIPGDNMDCKQDCFFDGNSGHGDDGCIWDLKCDPENPGQNIGCEYSGGMNCENMPSQTEECIEFCAGLVPNGCDCFGCCTVQTDEGEVHIFLNSGPDCSLDNLDACLPCTPQIDICGNPCEPEKCEICFGETELPEGCDEPECPPDIISCGENGEVINCPDGYYCVTGCCVPFEPPG